MRRKQNTPAAEFTAMSIPGRENNDGTTSPTLWFVVRADSGRAVKQVGTMGEAVRLAEKLNG